MNEVTGFWVQVPPNEEVNVNDPPVSPVVTDRLGVVTLVIRSELFDPESLAVASTGAEGASGAEISMLMTVLTDTAETFPALSV